LERMIALARLIEGERDVAAFAAADERQPDSTVRTIFFSCLKIHDERLVYRVSGSGFLKHMVRNIVGTLIEAGKGNLDEYGMRELLQPGAAQRAGPTAPAKGLFLIR